MNSYFTPEKVGQYSVYLALIVCVFGFLTAIFAQIKKRTVYVRIVRNSVWAMSLAVLTATLSLWQCLLTGRYHVEYVHQHANDTMPTIYKLTALWGGQNGSLLFWLLILCIYSSIVMWQNREKNYNFLPMVAAVLLAIAGFFLVLISFDANPFSVVPFNVDYGQGLNPLLQNYYMIIHPPSLYFGYVGMTVPFAFAVAALITGQLDNRWIVQVRIWTLVAWFFLSLGNLLGASWAYEVLGWGGYWAWDPVENAAFMPWLTASAFLHSAIIQEKRGMLKTWNMALVILSFVMTLLGTFLTRSGIVSSVHSFAQSNIGTYFLVILIATVGVSVGLLLYRLKDLQSQHELDAIVSRESAFLFNNLVLVGAAFAILWGTLFPVLSEWVRGTKITVGAPYFNSIMVPIGLILLFLTGVGPLVAWRKTSEEQLKKHFLWPIVFLLSSSLILLFVAPKTSSLLNNIYINISFSLCAFVLASIFFEYKHGVALRQKFFKENSLTALTKLVISNKRRYGGYIVHMGLVLLFFGFTGSAYRHEKEFKLKINQVAKIKNYTLKFETLYPDNNKHREKVIAKINVWKNKDFFGELAPSLVFYTPSHDQEAQQGTEISVIRSIKEDVYAAMITFSPQEQSIYLKIIITPLINFIWFGGLFLVLGGVVVMLPSSKEGAVYV